jgi:multidrug resistance efflux pump
MLGVTFALLTSVAIATSKPLLLTGELVTTEKQQFVAPKTDAWRVTIEYMPPEGSMVKAGEVVVSFDSGNLSSKLKQEEDSLHLAQEQLVNIIASAKQSELEAQFALTKAELELTKARVDAEVPRAHLSEFEYQENQLKRERAVIELAKAKEILEKTKAVNQVEIEKQKITIKTHQHNISLNQSQLEKMSLRAQQDGVFLYGNHMWTQEKLDVGMTVQASQVVAEIPVSKSNKIEAWIHETDITSYRQTMASEIRFDIDPKTVYQARLDAISSQPEAKPNLGQGVYFKATFSLQDMPTFNLVPGMQAQIKLSQGVEHNAL